MRSYTYILSECRERSSSIDMCTRPRCRRKLSGGRVVDGLTLQILRLVVYHISGVSHLRILNFAKMLLHVGRLSTFV